MRFWLFAFAGWLVNGAEGFAAVPLRWGGLPARSFFLAPRESPNDAAIPQTLSIRDAPSPNLLSAIPRFTANLDNTVTWSGTTWCIEVGGTKNGDVVRINHCSGGPNQKWIWMPWGPGGQNRIQLKDTNKCLDVGEGDGILDGSPILLQECEDKVTASWKFEKSIPVSMQSPLRHSAPQSSIQYVMIVLIVLTVLGALGVGTWPWLFQQAARTLVDARSTPFSDDRSGVCLSASSAPCTRNTPLAQSDGIAQWMSPAVLATSPSPSEETCPVQPGDPQICFKDDRPRLNRETDTVLDVDEVVKTLQKDLPQIIRAPPTWDIFSDEFRLVESTGDVVEGLAPVSVTLGLLRTMRDRFEVRDDIEVEFKVKDQELDEANGKFVLEAQWKVRLGLERPAFNYASSPLLQYADVAEDMFIEAASSFHLNANNQVDLVQIDKWSIRGKTFNRWAEWTQADCKNSFLRTKLKELFLGANVKNCEGDEECAVPGEECVVPGPGGELVVATSDLAVSFGIIEFAFLLTAAGNAALSAAGADTISQMVSYYISCDHIRGVTMQELVNCLDVPHVAAFTTSASLFSGFFNALWLQLVERMIPGADAVAVLSKTAADFCVAGTIVNTGYLTLTPFFTMMYGGASPESIFAIYPSPEHIFDGLTIEKFWNAMNIEAATFGPYNIIGFWIIKPEVRPFTSAFVSALRDGILSVLTRQ